LHVPPLFPSSSVSMVETWIPWNTGKDNNPKESFLPNRNLHPHRNPNNGDWIIMYERLSDWNDQCSKLKYAIHPKTTDEQRYAIEIPNVNLLRIIQIGRPFCVHSNHLPTSEGRSSDGRSEGIDVPDLAHFNLNRISDPFLNSIQFNVKIYPFWNYETPPSWVIISFLLLPWHKKDYATHEFQHHYPLLGSLTLHSFGKWHFQNRLKWLESDWLIIMPFREDSQLD
jgi:hypothetical protein